MHGIIQEMSGSCVQVIHTGNRAWSGFIIARIIAREPVDDWVEERRELGFVKRSSPKIKSLLCRGMCSLFITFSLQFTGIIKTGIKVRKEKKGCKESHTLLIILVFIHFINKLIIEKRFWKFYKVKVDSKILFNICSH